jgi:hypothetical protein
MIAPGHREWSGEQLVTLPGIFGKRSGLQEQGSAGQQQQPEHAAAIPATPDDVCAENQSSEEPDQADQHRDEFPHWILPL